MPILKRLTVWLLEILLEALLLSALLIVVSVRYSGPTQKGFEGGDILFGFVSVLVVFMWGSRYLITTAIAGLFLRGQRLLLYPVFAVALYLGHLNYVFRAFKVGWDLSERLWFDIGGGCIVFTCTLAGNFALRKWTKAQG